MRVRSFCFTYNNYTDEGEKKLKKWIELNCRYGIFGHEVGSEGTPHLQGYMHTVKQVTIVALQKKLPIRMAVFVANGTSYQNKAYCMKEDSDYWEFGDVKMCGQGARSDLYEPCEKIRNGIAMSNIIEEHPIEYVKFHRGLELLASHYEAKIIPEIRELDVTLLYGDPGAGKSYYCREFCTKYKLQSYSLPSPNNGAQWWNGYVRQEVLIIDDFYGWVKYSELLKILDPYKYQGHTKGGFKFVWYEHVLITSNRHYTRWYNKENVKEYTEEALDRRINNVYFCTIRDGERIMVPEKECNELIFSE